MLVDTSVWIDFLRGTESAPVVRLKDALAAGERVALTGVIYTEILQGAASAEDFERLKATFEGQVFLAPHHPVDSYAEAARLFFLCRRAGVTLRSTLDCLIAQIAIEQAVPLLQKDRDFLGIAEVAPELILA